MNKFTEFWLHVIPGPLKRRPKLAIFLVIAGGIGTLGSGLAGFTDVLDFFKSTSYEEKYITHQQFNTLMVPLIDRIEQMDSTIQQLREQKINSEKTVTPPPRIQPDLQQTLDHVKQLQQQQ